MIKVKPWGRRSRKEGKVTIYFGKQKVKKGDVMKVTATYIAHQIVKK